MRAGAGTPTGKSTHCRGHSTHPTVNSEAMLTVAELSHGLVLSGATFDLYPHVTDPQRPDLTQNPQIMSKLMSCSYASYQGRIHVLSQSVRGGDAWKAVSHHTRPQDREISCNNTGKIQQSRVLGSYDQYVHSRAGSVMVRRKLNLLKPSRPDHLFLRYRQKSRYLPLR